LINLNATYYRNSWKLYLIGAVALLFIAVYVGSFALFFIKITKNAIKDRSPFLVLISTFSGFLGIMYMLFRNYFGLVLVCPISYYLLFILSGLFFLPYFLRYYRSIRLNLYQNKSNTKKIRSNSNNNK